MTSDDVLAELARGPSTRSRDSRARCPCRRNGRTPPRSPLTRRTAFGASGSSSRPKKLTSRYKSGPCRSWLKIKNRPTSGGETRRSCQKSTGPGARLTRLASQPRGKPSHKLLRLPPRCDRRVSVVALRCPGRGPRCEASFSNAPSSRHDARRLRATKTQARPVGLWGARWN